jgi:hypothetical protein
MMGEEEASSSQGSDDEAEEALGSDDMADRRPGVWSSSGGAGADFRQLGPVLACSW